MLRKHTGSEPNRRRFSAVPELISLRDECHTAAMTRRTPRKIGAAKIGVALLTGVLAAVQLSVGLGSPAGAIAAEAEPTGSISTSNGVLFVSCVRHRVKYSVDVGDAIDWSLVISSRSKADVGPSVIVSEAMGHDASGRATLDFCDGAGGPGSERPGRYTLSGELRWTDSAFVPHTTLLTPKPFTMAPAPTRTKLVSSDRTPRAGQPFRLKTKVQMKRANGSWTRASHVLLGPVWVKLQARVPGRPWEYPKGSKTILVNGKASWKYRWTGKGKRLDFRVKTLRSARLGVSTSPALRIRTAK